MKFYGIEEGAIARVKAVAGRLNETGLNGYELRDLAQTLGSVARTAFEILGPETGYISAVVAHEAISNAICEHKFTWCRARLLHALAGAAEQGILPEVIEELFPMSGPEVTKYLQSTLRKNGWLEPKSEVST